MKHSYPDLNMSADDKRRWRRMARKQARAEGSYVAEARFVGVKVTGFTTTHGQSNLPSGFCPKCREKLDYTKRAETEYEGKIYHYACSPAFDIDSYVAMEKKFAEETKTREEMYFATSKDSLYTDKKSKPIQGG